MAEADKQGLVGIAGCAICRELPDVATSFSKYGNPGLDKPLPEAANRLIPFTRAGEQVDEKHHVRRCPLCGTFYKYDASHDYQVNGTEDEEQLTRLTPGETRSFVSATEYGAAMARVYDLVRSKDVAMRRYAGRCLAAHCMAVGNGEGLEGLEKHSDPDIAHGAKLCDLHEDAAPERLAKFAVVKTSLSKGDVMFQETIEIFEREQEASGFLEEYIKGRAHGFCWSDWDEYDVVPLTSITAQS